MHGSNQAQRLRLTTTAVQSALLLTAAMMSLRTVAGANQDGLFPRIISVVLVILVTSVLATKRFSAFVYAYLLVVPFYNVFRRIYYAADGNAYTAFESAKLSDPLVALPAVLFILGLCGACWVAACRRTATLDTSYRMIGRPLGVFVLLGVVAGLAQPSVSALVTLVLYGISPLVFFVPVRLMNDLASIKRLFLIAVLTGFATALYGLKQVAVGLADFETAWVFGTGFYSATTGDGLYRIFSTMSSQGHFADFMVAAIILSVAGIRMRYALPMKLFMIAVLPIMGYTLLSAMVRSSWFGLAAGLVFMFGVLQVNEPAKRPARVLLLGVVLVSMIAFGGTRGDTQNIEPERQSSARTYNQLILDQKSTVTNPLDAPTISSRMGRIADALPWVLTHPLGGLTGGEVFEVENYYVDIALKLGWIGIIAFIWCAVNIMRAGTRVYDSLANPDLRGIAAAGMSLLVSLLVAGLAGPHITVQPVAMYLWLLVGSIPMLSAMDADARRMEADAHNDG